MHIRKPLLSQCLWLLVAGCASLNSQSVDADIAQEYTVKAAITLNFARFTEWPETVLAKSSSTINLCVLGDNIVEQAFTELNDKQVGGRSLTVTHLSRLRSLESCHVLFVSGLDKNKIIQLLAEINKYHILSIGEQDYFIDYGGIVNLEMAEGKIIIQVNVDAAKQSGLNISSRVLKLAQITKPK